MVTNAKCAGIKGDSYEDIVVVGKCMGIKIFINENGKLVDKSDNFLNNPHISWWNNIEVSNHDIDGNMDFIAGNLGTNNQMKPSLERPVVLRYADYDVMVLLIQYFFITSKGRFLLRAEMS